MPASSIFTRKKMGLDNSVWLVMLFLIILSAGLLSYTTITTKKEVTCNQVNIHVNGRKEIENINFKLGEQLTFRTTPIDVDDKVVWEFGDASPKKEGGSASHAFTTESLYTVRVTINGKCLYEKKVHIKKPEIGLKDTLGNITENIIGNDQAFVGEKVKFSTPHEAQTYEWHIENNNSYQKKNGREVTYTFRSQNTYVLTLVLDKDRQKKFTKAIIVSKKIDENKPQVLIPDEVLDVQVQPDNEPAIKDSASPKPPPPVVKPRSKILTDAQFTEYIQNVVCQSMKVEDFDRYLCKGGETDVIINNKTRKTFAAMCAEIKGKKIKIISVRATREKENCATILTIVYDQKGWMAKDPCKD